MNRHDSECNDPAQSARNVYMGFAQAIVDQAVKWLDEDGVIRNPIDGGHDDRWEGGTAARFACPAAILAAEYGRDDMVEPASRALTQVITGVVQRALNDAPVRSRGLFDLVMKELVQACVMLKPMAPTQQHQQWADVLSAFPQDKYRCDHDIRLGRRPTNFAISAVVGEWFRHKYGFGGSRDWIETTLGDQLRFFTDKGMYRDPHDPMLYDLMVRQNLNELLWHGYDGGLREKIETMLDVADTQTLDMLSPCGYAPFGGRSNAMIHNEAMAIYCFERQASASLSDVDRAGDFRCAARLSSDAVSKFIHSDPLRFIKNMFDPITSHGKESSYGEYANYALLAASLFARAALVAGDRSALGRVPADMPSRGKVSTVHLWPAFHRTFATVGDTQVEIDTRAQASYDATGIGRFHRKGAPADLGLSMPISANPSYVLHDAQPGRAAAHGPCWKTRGGEWQSLAGLSDEIEDVTFTEIDRQADSLSWRLKWSLTSLAQLAVTSISQTFTLSPGELCVQVEVDGLFDCLGWDVPCLVTDGSLCATTTIVDNCVKVTCDDWAFQVNMPAPCSVTLE
ncbi:MAG: hypothetical protein GXY44_03130, partial [Phycisphaerales bacterium]|nr:hypothetical protein [Phycisphaerales bacterium]